MKKLFFLLFPFLLFGYSHNLFCYYDNVEEKIHCYTPIDTIPACAAYKKYGMFYPVMGGIVWGHGVTHHTDPQCVSKNYKYGFVYETVHSSTCLSSSGEPYAYDSIAEFCNADDKKGYTYDKNLNAWFASGKTPICSPGNVFDPSTQTCKEAPKCNLQCNPPKIINKNVCQCVCPQPLITDKLGNCIPNPNLNKDQCQKEGGIYMDNNILDTFSSINNAIASLYAPPGEHYCYTLAWVNAKKQALKAKVAPKNVLFTALSFLPLGKLGKLIKWVGIGDKIIEEAKSPKMLQDNRAVIDTKYNPQTGTYEPVIQLKPRNDPLPENQLFQNPTSLEQAENIVKPTKNLDDFLRSKFAEVDFDTPSELDQAVISYDLDTGLREGTQTKIAEDLRDIFKKSEISSSSQSFPMALKDYVGDEGSVQTEVTREITPIGTQGQTKIYNIKYDILPQGASTPVVVEYHTEVTPEPNSKENIIKVTPLYQIGKSTITGQPLTLNPTSNNSNQELAKDQPHNPDFTTFKSPAENAIKQAFNYKITLFTCPNVSPNCPHNVKINYNLAGIKGQYIIPDPMCSVISTINNPHVSPAVDKAGDLIVLFAGIFGFLTLFRRD